MDDCSGTVVTLRPQVVVGSSFLFDLNKVIPLSFKFTFPMRYTKVALRITNPHIRQLTQKNVEYV